ncbi:MAG: rhodanese-like domain-containing protein [Micropruina sp.]
MEINEISVSELPDDAVVLDVREPGEWAAGRARNAVHIPLGEVIARLAELPVVDGPLPVICRSGARSAQVTAYLVANGIAAVNVAGGTLAWARAGKPMAADQGEPFVV